MKYTVFGSTGFIGRSIVKYLQAMGHEVNSPSRHELFSHECDLGGVIYCIGLTGDFRSRPFDTIEANIEVFARLMKTCQFSSLVYLSSTRVYNPVSTEPNALECSTLSIFPNSDALYDLSKLLAESLCCTQRSRNVCVARISNVVGAGLNNATFLGAIADTLKAGRPLVIKEGPNSRKDYVCIDDVVSAVCRISSGAKEGVYNVSSATSVSHQELAEMIFEEFGVDVSFSEQASDRIFPTVDNRRICNEFPDIRFRPARVVVREFLGNIYKEYFFEHQK